MVIYSGQLDVIIGAPLTERFLLELKWSHSKEYLNAQRKVWRVEQDDAEVAGFVRTVKNVR